VSGDARVAVEARLAAPAEVRLGDVVDVAIVVRGEGAASARVTAPRDAGAFEVIGEPARVASAGADEAPEAVFVARLQPFATGRLTVPPFVVEVAGGEPARSQPLAVDVVALTSATSEPAAAKLVLPAARDGALLPALGIALVVAAVGYRAWRLRGAPVPARRAVTSARAPVDEIEALVAAVARGRDVDTAFDDLSRIVVRFVVRRFEMTERERTSAEIVRALAERHGAHLAHEVRDLLEPCDVAKFARGARDDEAFRRHATAAAAFMRRWQER
jgi:hypothetical protein